MNKLHRFNTVTDTGYLWTGQLTCHDVNGHQVNCEQSGQDAEFKNGLHMQSNRFEVDNKIALDYVADMNESWFLGYSDWSMPNRHELHSLVDLQEKNLRSPKTIRL